MLRIMLLDSTLMLFLMPVTQSRPYSWEQVPPQIWTFQPKDLRILASGWQQDTQKVNVFTY